MKKVKVLLVMIILPLLFNCTSVSARELIKPEKITVNHVEPYKYTRTFIIRFSNIIYHEAGREIKIPIFQGKYEDVLYKDFRDYCFDKKLLEYKVRETGFMIKTKKGETRKTFHDFLTFYKSNILRNVDIEKPTMMSLGSTDWVIKYDFTVNGIPCYMQIELTPRDEDLNKAQKDMIMKSVFDIIPDETEQEPGFLYKFYIGSKSTDR